MTQRLKRFGPLRPLLPALLVAFLIALLTGCLEDEVEIKVNADGSGTVSRTVTLSDRLVISAQDNDGPGPQNNFPMTKEEMQEVAGDAIKVGKVSAQDKPDGSRVLHITGSFDSVTDFLASDFADELGLSIVRADDNTAQIVWDTQSDDGGGPDITLNQMYGLAKGMHVTRTITMPTTLTSDTGRLTAGNRTVSWSLDLRNKVGLEATRALVGDDGGERLTANFAVKGVRFNVPTAEQAASEQVANAEAAVAATGGDAEQATPAGLKAKVTAIELKRARQVVEVEHGFPVEDALSLHMMLEWPENARPQAISQPQIEAAEDNTGKSVMPDHQFDNRQSTEHMGGSNMAIVNLGAPAAKATELASLKGHYVVVLGTETKTVTVDNPKAIVGKSKTGEADLDKFKFKLEAIEDTSVRIAVDGGKDRFKKIIAVLPDGKEVESQGYGGWDRTYSYSFNESIAGVKAFKFDVMVSEKTAKVPFSASNIQFP